MNHLSFLQKKYALIRMNEIVEKLVAEGILTLGQAEQAYRLTAQQMAGK